MLPVPIELLAEKLRYFSGVGHRGSLKLALDILLLPGEKFDEFESALESVRKSVTFCENCGFFAEKKPADSDHLCSICQDKKRVQTQLCLVEKATDVITVEKSQVYRGYYHVLNNLISPLDNIFAENTTISDLVNRRIPELLEELPKHEHARLELILFFKAGFAAEATTAYLKEVLKQYNLLDKVTLTRLAQGLPLYYNPDTLDQATMAKAVEDRREV